MMLFDKFGRQIGDAYVVDTLGGAVWYGVHRSFGWGRKRLRVRVCTGYREPS